MLWDVEGLIFRKMNSEGIGDKKNRVDEHQNAKGSSSIDHQEYPLSLNLQEK